MGVMVSVLASLFAVIAIWGRLSERFDFPDWTVLLAWPVFIGVGAAALALSMHIFAM